MAVSHTSQLSSFFKFFPFMPPPPARSAIVAWPPAPPSSTRLQFFKRHHARLSDYNLNYESYQIADIVSKDRIEMSQPLTALRLRAALHLLSLEGADISNIVRAHAQSLGLQMDVCQPLPRESAAALDAVVALAAHINESVYAVSAAAPSSYEGIEGDTDWFGESSLGGDFGDFAFPALQHREGGGQMTFQVRFVFRFLLCVSTLRAFFGCGFFLIIPAVCRSSFERYQ
jgi:hypothetical protein